MQYFGKPEGRVKIQMMSKNLQRYYTLKCLIRDLLSNVFVPQKFWLAKVFNLSRGRGNETSTNLYSFRALFVLYEAVLDNKVILLDFMRECFCRLTKPHVNADYKAVVFFYERERHGRIRTKDLEPSIETPRKAEERR